MSRVVYFVRHTAVELVAHAPPHEWVPTPAGLDAAQRLAAVPVWRNVALVATSTEPKARTTAEPIAAAAGVPLRHERDLREIEREQGLLDAEAHRDRVRRYLAGEAIPGWEGREDAARRVDECLARLRAETHGPLVVVSHATVLALHLGLSCEQWAAIPLPAVAVARGGRLVAPFRSVDEFLAVSARSRG